MSVDELHILRVHREKDDVWGAVIFTDKDRPPVASNFMHSEEEIEDWVARMKATKPWEIN